MDNLEHLARHPHSTGPNLAVRDTHESFLRLTRLARRGLKAPEALILLLESTVGPVDAPGTFRQAALAYGLCHCVVESGEPLVVVQTRDQGGSGAELIAFAGVPLRDLANGTVGALCVIDHRPRRWSDADLRFLRELGRAAETELALREATTQLTAGAPA